MPADADLIAPPGLMWMWANHLKDAHDRGYIPHLGILLLVGMRLDELTGSWHVRPRLQELLGERLG